jgi:HEAT repeat protein
LHFDYAKNAKLWNQRFSQAQYPCDTVCVNTLFSQSLARKPSKRQPLKALKESQPPEFTPFHIEQAIATLTTGDFPSKWDYARQFAKQFAHWGDRPIPYLIDRLHSSSIVEDHTEDHAEDHAENQWFLIRTLGQYQHPSVVEALANFLISTPDEALQIEATKALTRLGSGAIATLTHLITSPTIETRRLAASTLAKIRRSAVIEPLLGVANDPDAQIRGIAIEALGSFHDPRITPVLLSALQDETAIAIEAVRTLGRRSDLLATTDVIALLQGALLGQAEDLARESAIALGRLGAHSGGELAAEALGKFLTQPAPTEVKIAAARALGWLTSPTATLYLATAFECPFPLVMPEVRLEIARSLGQTQSVPLQLTAAQPLVRWIQSQVQSQVQSQAQQQAQQPSGPDNFALKQTVLSALARLAAVGTLDSLIPLLGDPDARIRMHALNALKQIDPDLGQVKVADYLRTEALSAALKAKIADSLSAW